MNAHKFTRIDWLVAAAIGFAVLMLYAPTIGFQFVNFDDDLYVYENPHVRAGLTASGIGWAMTSGYASNWHPLTWMSHMLDVELFGLSPGGPHAVNALIHAANSILLFVVLLQMSSNRWAACLAAAVFAVHPLRVESVAWVSERKDLLCGLFFMLSLLAYLRWAQKKSLRSYLLLLAFFALGLMSKPMLVTLPFVLLLLDVWPISRWHASNSPRLVAEKLPLIGLAAVSSIVTFAVQNAGKSVSHVEQIGLWPRVQVSVVSYVRYLLDFVWPSNLAVFYPHPFSIPGGGISSLHLVTSAAIVAVLTAIALVFRKRAPFLAIGWFWYVGMLVPVIGLVQVGSQSHADRYTYLPMIGINIAIAFLLATYVTKTAWSIVCGASILVLAGFCVLTSFQIQTWRNTDSLMLHAIKVVPNNYAAHNNLGNAYDDRGDHQAAEEQYRAVLAINPNDTIGMNNLAVRLAAKGEVAEAKKLFKAVIERDHDYAPPYVALGNIYAAEKRLSDAQSLYEQAIAIDPAFAEAFHRLALINVEQGDLSGAIHDWQSALSLDPANADAHHAYGIALLQSGRANEGVAELRAAINIEPNRLETKSQLAWILATHPSAEIRNPSESAKLAAQVVDAMKTPSAASLDTLAAARAAVGDFAGAASTAQQALQKAKREPTSALVDDIQFRLDLYLNKTAFIQGMRRGPR